MYKYMVSNECLIYARGLTKQYIMGSEKIHALSNIDIEIYKGEFLGIMGPSGSGKSTMISILGCLDRPSSGMLNFAGQDVSLLADGKLSRIRALNIGFVFQTFNLVTQCTVLQNVAMPFLYNPTVSQKDAIQRAENALDRVGVLHRKHHRPSELSGGEMQRVAIARAIVTNPQILLADEPTGNLDRKTGEAILLLFKEINRQGTTLVVVTHDTFVGSCCRRIIYLQDGQIVN